MEISPAQLKERMDQGSAPVLIDVREDHEHEEFNIGGRLVPLGTLQTEVENLDIDKEGDIVVYCRSGGRSAMAQKIMKAAGFNSVFNLTGGMLAWQDEFSKD